MRVDWTIYISFLGAGLITLLPRESKTLIRWVALLPGTLGLLVALRGYFAYDAWIKAGNAGFWPGLDVNVPWIATLGINYHLTVDGINFPLVVLNGFVCVTGILFSWNIEERVKEFFAFFLTLIAGVYGVFMAMDLFLLFVFYELAIIPKYFIIAIWGSTRKEYGAMKLVLYSFLGSALVFIGVLAAVYAAGGHTFDILELRNAHLATDLQRWMFPLLFVGFAVLAGMWPLHTWAPTGHVAAPTAASMLLAGIVMKLGSYAGLRVAMNLFPQGFQMWSKWIVFLAVVGIVYAAAAALRQRDLKFVIGYSSVSHMGFVLLGLGGATALSVSGAVLQMFSHGVIAALLFAVAGRMIYRRTHTRDLDALAGLNLGSALPFAAFTFVIAAAASMGIPGFSGFAAEITILIGASKTYPLAVWITGAGMVLVAAFTLRALKQSFFGETKPDVHLQQARVALDPDWNEQQPITTAEKCGACLLMFTTFVVGVYPKLLLDRIMPAVEAMRFLK